MIKSSLLLQSIKEDKPINALSLAIMLKHSSAKYGDIVADSYYSFDALEFTLLGFKLKSSTITLFDQAIGHVTCHYKGDENNGRLVSLLTPLPRQRKTDKGGR